MRILIDIGHPAHVHYFKNFIWQMQKKGHEFMITARDKEVALNLLDKYGFGLDIVYSDPEFHDNISKYYDKVFFWNNPLN